MPDTTLPTDVAVRIREQHGREFGNFIIEHWFDIMTSDFSEQEWHQIDHDIEFVANTFVHDDRWLALLPDPPWESENTDTETPE